jgi:hypothetical protein
VPEIALDRSSVRALIGESQAAGMAQHVGDARQRGGRPSRRTCAAAG